MRDPKCPMGIWRQCCECRFISDCQRHAASCVNPRGVRWRKRGVRICDFKVSNHHWQYFTTSGWRQYLVEFLGCNSILAIAHLFAIIDHCDCIFNGNQLGNLCRRVSLAMPWLGQSPVRGFAIPCYLRFILHVMMAVYLGTMFHFRYNGIKCHVHGL